MHAWIRIAAVVTGAAVAAAAAAAVGATKRWERDSARLVSRLEASARHDSDDAEWPTRTDASFDSLPPPVARYFAFALLRGQPRVRRAHLRFAGTFATKPNDWAPFTAEQDIVAEPPGFVWDARIDMMPLASVRVRDSYVGREGAMRAKLAGVVPLVDQHGSPEIAAASLLRFLAEAVWLPTALLPHDGLAWSAIDDTTARVTLVDGPTTVSMQVQFGSRGEITTVSAMRYRDVNGTPVLTQWIGQHADYRRVDGMIIPTAGEVAWVLPEGPTPYWRGRIVEASYDR
jgi:hypothetical protein